MIKYSLGNMKKGLGLGVSDVHRIILKEYPARYLAPLPTQPLLRVLSRSAYDIIIIICKRSTRVQVVFEM